MRFVTADLGEPLSLKNVTGQHSMYPRWARKRIPDNTVSSPRPPKPCELTVAESYLR